MAGTSRSERSTIPVDVGAAIYPFRIVGFYLAGVSVYLARGVDGLDPPWSVWWVLLLFASYPHIAFARYASRQTRDAEVVNLQVDMFLIGLIAALVSFNPGIVGAYLVANSAANHATRGAKLVARGLGWFVVGAVLGALLFGAGLDLETTVGEFVTPLLYLAAATHYIGYLSYVRGRALVREREAAERLAYVDGLTGVANRRRFDALLDQSWDWGQHQATPLSLILLDIDHFKRYNDHYGHPAGDECLRRVARAIADAVEAGGGIVARTGGEEFGILLPGTGGKAARSVGVLVRTTVRSLAIPHEASPVADVVTVSVGVATVVPVEALTPRALLLGADQALYRAKEAGRDQVSAREVTGTAEASA